jgi:hypothetical protein
MIILFIAGRKRADFDTALAFNFLLLPLMSPLLEYHHHTWQIVAYFIFWRQLLEGKIRGWFLYIQSVLWLILISNGYLVDLGFPSYYPATLSVLGLWLLYGLRLLKMSSKR